MLFLEKKRSPNLMVSFSHLFTFDMLKQIKLENDTFPDLQVFHSLPIL